MWQWLTANWGWLLLSVLLGSYFSLYVLAMRHQQRSGPDGPKLPCDRC